MKTMLFVHGWPDDASLWEKQVEFFKDIYHCVTVTLPGFSPEDSSDTQVDFPELVDFLAATIRKEGAPAIVVGHDWGAYLTYMLEERHPELVEKVVALDVGGQIHLNGAMVAYQSFLAASWLARNALPHVTTRLSQMFATLVKAPKRNGGVDVKMNYLYYFFWRDLLIPKYRDHLLKDYRPNRPVLFLYGKSKPFMFHSKKWEEMLSLRADCEIHGVEKAGHWLMRNRPEEVNALIDKWLSQKR
jgi:cis-3-alkyl-4-acyloxetan-2-one decarboxylase